jgi:hypothetical protein
MLNVIMTCVVMLNVIRASVVKLKVIRLSAMMVSVVAPSKHLLEYILQKFALAGLFSVNSPLNHSGSGSSFWI